MPDSTWTYQGIAFTCDEGKRRENLRKHGIDLYEASAVFSDPQASLRYDFEHSAHHLRTPGGTARGKKV